MYRKNQMIGSWKIGIVLFLFTFLVIGVLPAQATITPVGAVTPVYPPSLPDPWDISSLIVGDGANGWLTIGDIGDPNTVNVIGGSAWVGYANDSSSSDVEGWLYVRGQTAAGGSTLTVDPNLTIGAAMVDPCDQNAYGYLYIEDGGVVDVIQDLILASDANTANSQYSYGYIHVWDPNSRLHVRGDLYAAHGQDSYVGRLNAVGFQILNGAVADVDGNAYLAYGEDSLSFVGVMSPNSRLNIDSDLYSGYGANSISKMIILDEGVVDVNGNAYLAYGVDSESYLYVYDPNSRLNLTGSDLYLGYGEDSYSYTEIYNGGVVDVNGNAYLAYGVGSEGYLEVYNPNSRLNLTGSDLYVADGNGSYAEVDIYDGGVVDVNDDAHFGSGGGRVYLADEQLLYNDYDYDQTYANIEIHDVNSRLNVGGDLYIADGNGANAVFDIYNEGVVDVVGDTRIGGDVDAYVWRDYVFPEDDDLVNYNVSRVWMDIYDANSRLNVGGNLYVADGNGYYNIDAGEYQFGSDVDVDISLGGVVDVGGDAFIGYGDGSEGYVGVDRYSQFNYGGMLYLGYGTDSYGQLDTWEYSDANSPFTVDAIVAYGVGSTGYLNIMDVNNQDVTDVTLNSGASFIVGYGDDSTGQVYINDVNTINVAGDIILGHGVNSSGTMTVDGPIADLNYDGMLYLGYGQDASGMLNIDLGDLGSAKDMNAILGYGEDSSGTLVIQDVNNQQLNLVNNDENGFALGHGDDSEANLYINNAKKINVDGDLILAKGDGSLAMLEIDFSGADNEPTHLDINGGEGNLYLGYGDGSRAGGDLDGDQIFDDDPLRIHDPLPLILLHGHGMVVDVNDVYLGYGDGSWGAMSVDEASRLNYNGTLYVGYDGEGYLDINYGWVDSPVNMNAILAYGEGSYGELDIYDVNGQDLNLSSNANGDFIVGNGDVDIIGDVNGINVSGDLILAKNVDSSAQMTFYDANSLDVGGTLYLGYGEDSEGELPIGNGVSVNVNEDVFVDYGPGDYSSESELNIFSNANLDVGGNLWVGYGNNSGGSVWLEDNAVLDVNDDIILGFQSDSYGSLTVSSDSDLSFGGQMFVGYGGQGTLNIEDVDTLDLDEDVVFFGYGAGSRANVDIDNVNRVNVTGNLNLAYGQDSHADVEIDDVNRVNVTGDLNLAYGQDSWGEMRLGHVSDVNVAGDLNLAYGQDSRVYNVELTSVNMSVGGDLNLGYGDGSTFGTLNVLDSRVDVGNSLYMGYGGTADELIITRSFVGVGSNPYALDEGLSIGADGTLAGEGRIWGEVYNRGTIAPGSPIGTLNIVGDLTFDVNSVYAVDIADSDNSSDKIEVKGDLIINGGTVEVTPTETITQDRQYTIAEAHSVTNSPTDGWDSNDVIVTAPSVLLDVEDPHLVVGDTDVVLGVKPLKFGEPEVLQTKSGNQAALGGALDQIVEEGGNDVTYALQQIDSESDLLDAFNQLGNQSRPPMDSITSDVSMGFLGVMGERLRGIGPVAGRGYRSGRLLAMSGPVSATSGISPYGTMGTTVGYNNPVLSAMAVGRGSPVMSDRRWGLWTKGFGVFGDRDSKSGVAGHDYRVGGLGVGLDYMFTDAFLAGLTLGYSEGDVGYEGLRDNTDIGSTNLGAYASYEQDSWYMDAMFGYGKHEYDSIRYVDIVSQRLTASYDGHSLNGYVELGLNWRETETSLFQPLVGLQMGHVTIDSYQESGGTAAVGVDETEYDSIESSLGLKYTYMFGAMTDGPDGSVQLRGRWLHEFGDENSSADTYFTSNPDAVYKMQDAEVGRESALLGGSLSINISEQTLATIQYDVRLNSDETTQFIGGSLQYRW